ncbi:TPA: hypothetical protein ACKEXD_001749, partial [Enterococcus faecium]
LTVSSCRRSSHPRRLIVKDNRNSIRKEVLHLIKFVKKTVAIPSEKKINESTRKLYRRANKKALKLSAFLSSLSLKLSLILFISEHVSITDFLNLAKNPYLKGVRSILWQGLQSLACLEVRTWFSYSSCRKIFLMMILSIN